MASDAVSEPQQDDPEAAGETDLPSEADLREMLDVTVLVANDHDRVKRLWHIFKGPDLDAAKRRETAQEIVRDLTQHTAAEQEVLYPALRDIDSLKDQVHHALSEHASLVVLMCDVLAVAPDDDAGLVAKMEPLMEVFLEHIHEEEHGALAQLREELRAAQLRELGRRFEKARVHATTNPADLMGEGHREELGDDQDIEEAEGEREEEEADAAVNEGEADEEDVVEQVMNAHDGIKRLFHELRDPAVDEASRVALGQTLVEELTAVTAAEQEVLYPVLRENLGDQHVDHVLSIDASLVSIMCDLSNMDQQKDQRSYSTKINALMDLFQQHTHDEEHEGLARLRKMLPQKELRELGKRYGDAIIRAPIRPQLLAVGGEGRDI